MVAKRSRSPFRPHRDTYQRTLVTRVLEVNHSLHSTRSFQERFEDSTKEELIQATNRFFPRPSRQPSLHIRVVFVSKEARIA